MTHPNSAEARLMDDNPFGGLSISNNSILATVEGRYPCEKCHKSRKYFCYTCFIPHPGLKDALPKVKLPIKIDVIKHKREIDGKSTAAHAAILAPDDVTVYTYPDIPSYDDERVVLIFPSHTSLEIQQLFNEANINEIKSDFDIEFPKGFNRSTLLKNIPAKSNNNDFMKKDFLADQLPITRGVFIDSTWNQSKGIYKDERLRRLPTVVLQNRISQFWRHQRGSPRWYLATVEAIHQFVLEVHLNAWGVHRDYLGLQSCFTENALDQYKTFTSDGQKAYLGEYDDLLYFFHHMYKLIHMYYDHDNLHAYKRRLL